MEITMTVKIDDKMILDLIKNNTPQADEVMDLIGKAVTSEARFVCRKNVLKAIIDECNKKGLKFPQEKSIRRNKSYE